MRVLARIIKAFAILLAVLIIFAIFMGVFTGFSFIGQIFDNGKTGSWTSENYKDEPKKLEINVRAANLKIRKLDGNDVAKVDTDNKYISSWTDESGLHVVEKSHNFFDFDGNGEVVVYVREGYKFDEIEINVGAGTFEAADLKAGKLKLDLGAGKTEIEKVVVTEKLVVNGGAGTLTIKDGEAKDAKITIGAGKADLKLKFTGENKIECGVGRLDLELLWQKAGYTIDVDKGIGSVKLDGESLNDGDRVGDGGVKVEVESGVGTVEIKLGKENGRN